MRHGFLFGPGLDFVRTGQYIFSESHWQTQMKKFATSQTVHYIMGANAGIAQLVERNLAKVDVAGSSPVSRSVPVKRDNQDTQ